MNQNKWIDSAKIEIKLILDDHDEDGPVFLEEALVVMKNKYDEVVTSGFEYPFVVSLDFNEIVVTYDGVSSFEEVMKEYAIEWDKREIKNKENYLGKLFYEYLTAKEEKRKAEVMSVAIRVAKTLGVD